MTESDHRHVLIDRWPITPTDPEFWAGIRIVSILFLACLLVILFIPSMAAKLMAGILGLSSIIVAVWEISNLKSLFKRSIQVAFDEAQVRLRVFRADDRIQLEHNLPYDQVANVIFTPTSMSVFSRSGFSVSFSRAEAAFDREMLNEFVRSLHKSQIQVMCVDDCATSLFDAQTLTLVRQVSCQALSWFVRPLSLRFFSLCPRAPTPKS